GFYRDFSMLRGRGRVWILLSFAHPTGRRALVERLNKLGRPLASFGSGSGVDAVNLYLYSLGSSDTGRCQRFEVGWIWTIHRRRGTCYLLRAHSKAKGVRFS